MSLCELQVCEWSIVVDVVNVSPIGWPNYITSLSLKHELILPDNVMHLATQNKLFITDNVHIVGDRVKAIYDTMYDKRVDINPPKTIDELSVRVQDDIEYITRYCNTGVF